MKSQATAVLVATLVAFGQTTPLFAWRGGGGGWGGGRGSVSGASRGGWSGSWRRAATGTPRARARSARRATASTSTSRCRPRAATRGTSTGTSTRSKARSSAARPLPTPGASRPRATAPRRPRAATPASPAAPARARAVRPRGRARLAGTPGGSRSPPARVNTKYNGSYAGAAERNPYGGWNTATVGPYGGKVTTTLPSGYRTTSYYGRPYYAYGGAYYRPYSYGGMRVLLPGAAALLLLQRDGSRRRDHARGRRHDVPRHAAGQLLEADDEQQRNRRLPDRARARGRETADARRRAGAGDGGRHHLLPVLQHVLPARRRRGPGAVRGRDAARGRRVPARGSRRLQGRAAQHDVLQARAASTTCRTSRRTGRSCT